MFNDLTGVEDMPMKLLTAVTGRDFGPEERMRVGLRIFNIRHAFNLREGEKPADLKLPKRCVGEPPLKKGPLEGVTIDHKTLRSNFFKAIDWDETTGKPSKSSLEKIGGMEDVIASLKLE
jgi:aldehyde:ferredoxin oxidoreductase